MRVQAINNTTININRPIKNKAASPTGTIDRPVGDVVASQNIAFHGLFGASLSERFQYGMEALDNNSILVVTDTENEEKTNNLLKKYADKIDIPVLKKYTLIVKEKELKDNRSLDSSFAIFKKGNNYYVMNLGFWSLVVKNPKEKLDNKKHYLESGTIRELESGEAIETGEFYWGNEKRKLVFNPPYKYNPDKAEKHLALRSASENSGTISALNRTLVTALTSKPKEQQNTPKIKNITFKDVGGLDDLIAELRKFVIRPAKYPQVFENIRLNKGILLYGPPRCGKTLLGMALANEAGLNYHYMNASEFKRGIVGESEQMIRKHFEQIMQEPSILFIDEFDSVAKSRQGNGHSNHDDSVVNQLLGCMSDLEKTNIISFVIAATNRKDLLDNAMTSSGRFGLHLEIPMPDEKGLEAIYNIHSKGKTFDDDIVLPDFIKAMKQAEFNGSDVAEMISIGFFNSLERLGMNAKMDAGTFTMQDMKSISISKEDLYSALKKITAQKIMR